MFIADQCVKRSSQMIVGKVEYQSTSVEGVGVSKTVLQVSNELRRFGVTRPLELFTVSFYKVSNNMHNMRIAMLQSFANVMGYI